MDNMYTLYRMPVICLLVRAAFVAALSQSWCYRLYVCTDAADQPTSCILMRRRLTVEKNAFYCYIRLRIASLHFEWQHIPFMLL